MSALLEEKELAEAGEFLSKYVAEHRDSQDSVLVRPNCYCMTADEIEGEIIDLVLAYLSKRNCGSALKSALAHETVVEILNGNLEKFEQGKDVHLPSEDSTVKKYDAMSVAKAVFNHLYTLSERWAANLPKLHKNRFSYEISFEAIKNKRRKMEDKHFIMPDFNTLHGLGAQYPNQALFSVFDGHGGVDAACYAASQFHCNLKKFEKLSTQPLEALRYAFTKTDSDFIVKAKQERLKSGSTGVVVLIQNDTMYTAWVGDSQAVLGKNGVPVKLMEPHKPEREDERRRIEDLGGCVVWFGGWRVNGSLAVSRAIGDYEQKPFVSSDADISQYHFEGDEDYIIIACDGLWDTVSDETAIELIDSHIKDGHERSECASMLAKEAKARGSMDNISVIVVFLDSHKKTHPKQENETLINVANSKTNTEQTRKEDVGLRTEGAQRECGKLQGTVADDVIVNTENLGMAANETDSPLEVKGNEPIIDSVELKGSDTISKDANFKSS